MHYSVARPGAATHHPPCPIPIYYLETLSVLALKIKYSQALIKKRHEDE